jgi:polysaccharide biosynthesis transport protein
VDFKQVFKLFKRWYWLLIVGFVLGAAGGILVSRLQTPVYEATAKALVMRAPDQSTAALAYLSPEELATTFAQLITTQPVLDDLSNQLGFKVLKKQITIQPVANSQILKVIVDDDDPEVAAHIANGLVETSIKQFVALQTGLYTSSQQNIKAQLNDVQSKIFSLQTQIAQTSETILTDQQLQIEEQMTPLQDEVSQLQQDIARLSPVTNFTTAADKTLLAQKQARIAEIQPLLTAYQQAYTNVVVMKKPIETGSPDENNLNLLEKDLAQYQQNYTTLNSRLEALKQAETQGISNVVQMEKAYPPLIYIRPQILMNTLLMSAVGLVLAVVAVFMMENLEVTWKLSDIFRKRQPKEKQAKLKSTSRI